MQRKVIFFCQCFCRLVLCYYQAAAVLWQVADGCWIRLTCSIQARGCKPFCLIWWLLDLGGSSVRGKRSLVDELLQALTFGPAEPYMALNKPLIVCGQRWSDTVVSPKGWRGVTCLGAYRLVAVGTLKKGWEWDTLATSLSGEQPANSSWLALLCQPLQLFVPFW